MSKKTLFTGAGTALITPFTENGVNFDALGNIIEFQIENSVDALIICGTTGEAATMPDKEHLSVIEFAVKKTAGRIPIIAGTGSNDTAHCVELSQEAQNLGADGLLIVTPYYNKCTQKGLMMHFDKVLEKVNLPIILYNIPGRTGMQFKLDTLKELAKDERIVGVKEASGSIEYLTDLVHTCPELDVYSGNDDMVVPLLSLGGKGVISVLSNIAPKETHDLCQKFFDGDMKGSLALQMEYLDLIHALFCEVNPIPVKTAMNLMGFNAGPLRLPLCEMDDANLVKLKSAMADRGLI
ncbi:4-hydroxy-tetrahydrodipicolinate synthase [Congzhengia minquanensis]|uniref:4-hydroxy-tetrahydrodipicolinate synthase n=1 Tax=Congzhengia minquanensis TaxID=2763657 RepID=A0A926DNM3_9FIRM|nr:4-hydroxy-tetrahydrodipicolinate synthase [Congzhengia minquanensis]MBC8541002.1 4-hydroxy-tetrahydrodipicolinate synthase [Congzhengia minquanensis]